MSHDCPTGAHPDPSRGCYVHGCSCPGCVEANTRYFAEYRSVRRRLSGRPGGLVDSAHTIALVRWLMDAGASYNWISREAGVGFGNVGPLHHGDPERVRLSTYRRIERLARRVAQGEIQPPNFRDAQRRKVQRELRAQYRVPA